MNNRLGIFLLGMSGILLLAEKETGIVSEVWNVVTGKGIKAMREVDRSLLLNPNVQAFLAVIRRGEGTSDAGGYNRLFGGGVFTDMSKHPNKSVTKNGYTSTAAGAYQFLKSTWDETAQAMQLTDFSPVSQNIAALGRLAYRGAIEDIINGNFGEALRKTNKEWASLPGSPYGQPVMTYATALAVYSGNGGQVA